ncbi:MAG TPA: hypothetical protein VNM67_04855 [Thermoanaerobaculia bacterium]|jgi:hypothetical protein|nr:hypothetical protein [Thermoanaerobaculia bacterium]
MSVNLTLSEILRNLQRRIDSLREQVDLHARQEEHHREQRALLDAELQKAMRHLESLQEAAAVAADLDLPAAAPPPSPQEEDLGPNPTLPKMVARVVAGRPEGERFGPKIVAQEVNRRFRKGLRRPVDARAVSVVLRRMSAARRIHLVREGKANHEALYAKGAAPAKSDP